MAKPTRIILHVDMDAFFAAVEQRDRPELRGRPVIVGGSPQARGVVSTASYEARKFGIRSAMPAALAVRLCPQGVFLRPDFPKYRTASRQVIDVLRRHCDRIEQVSIDEAFVDLTGRVDDFAAAERVARAIKQDIRAAVSLTASVGVGPNKFLAKLASDHQKPDGLVVIRPEMAQAFLAPLPVVRLWGVGPKTAARLERAGVRTIGEVAAASSDLLTRLLGGWAEVAQELARGRDERPVETEREAKSASAEETFPQDLYDIADMRRVLARLSGEVSRRLRQDGARARTLAVKVRFGDFHTLTRQLSLREPTDRPDMIRRKASELLEAVARGEQGVRLLGVRATNLVREPGQLSLFDEQVQRRAQLERTLTYLRRRFGANAVRWAKESAEPREQG